jgi:hypothetical protein
MIFPVKMAWRAPFLPLAVTNVLSDGIPVFRISAFFVIALWVEPDLTAPKSDFRFPNPNRTSLASRI